MDGGVKLEVGEMIELVGLLLEEERLVLQSRRRRVGCRAGDARLELAGPCARIICRGGV